MQDKAVGRPSARLSQRQVQHLVPARVQGAARDQGAEPSLAPRSRKAQKSAVQSPAATYGTGHDCHVHSGGCTVQEHPEGCGYWGVWCSSAQESMEVVSCLASENRCLSGTAQSPVPSAILASFSSEGSLPPPVQYHAGAVSSKRDHRFF